MPAAADLPVHPEDAAALSLHVLAGKMVERIFGVDRMRRLTSNEQADVRIRAYEFLRELRKVHDAQRERYGGAPQSFIELIESGS